MVRAHKSNMLEGIYLLKLTEEEAENLKVALVSQEAQVLKK